MEEGQMFNSVTKLGLRSSKFKSLTGLLLLLIFFHPALFAEEETYSDWELWSGGIFLFKPTSTFHTSAEYQVRIDEDWSSLKQHFMEFMGYSRVLDTLVFNGGYRFTIRPDHYEYRLYLGGFLGTAPPLDIPSLDFPLRFKPLFQFGYQRDFDVEIDNRLIESNSLRFVMQLSAPGFNYVTPFVMGGVLTTWNEAHDFGIDKTRIGGGVLVRAGKQARFRVQYIFERSVFFDPQENSHIIWIRWEMTFP